MKKASIVLLAFLFACTKKNDLPYDDQGHVQKKEPESCNFGITQFNTTLRQAKVNGRKPSTGSNTATGGAVNYLDFDGHLVSNTSWNLNGDFVCEPANLTTEEMQRIFDRVAEDYRPFNVVVTADEAVYNAANPYKRMRVVITETWQWYGQAGGVSFAGSFTWGDNTPCFVFSSLLGYNEKKIAEASSHEVGHTLGLRHQSVFSESCGYITEYNAGAGTGEISWAPIMGNSYSRNVTTWHRGTSSAGCNAIQDDVATIANILGYIPDDHSNTSNGSTALSSTAEGIINNIDDVDFFSVNINSTKTLTVLPFSLGSNVGANMHLMIKIYSGRSLIATIYNPAALHVQTTLASGKYLVSVETTGNEYTDRYGMMGKYTIMLE